jgi:hypothetical protein
MSRNLRGKGTLMSRLRLGVLLMTVVCAVAAVAALAKPRSSSVRTVASARTPALASVATAQAISTQWKINYHGACCEGNMASFGTATYLLLPELLTGNDIKRSLNAGRTFTKVYPPADVSEPFGVEGDLRAYGNDVIFFGTEVAHGVSAHSSDRGTTWTVNPIPVAFPANDQAWLYLGPLSHLSPAQTKPYVLTGWYRIGSVALFSFDGGLTWPVQTPLVGVDGDGPAHVVCETVAHGPVRHGDVRIPKASFGYMKAGRHGGWGTDGKFYWSEVKDSNLYICKTDDFGATWAGTKFRLSGGSPPGYPVTNFAFDNKGTLYVLHANKLYVSFDQGESMSYVHTLPRWGNDTSVGDLGSAEFFVVNNGTIHIGLKEAGPNGTGNIWYLQGKGVDTARPTWTQELIDVVGAERLDFMQITVDGNGIPIISYTTPGDDKQVTTATRLTALR